MAEDKRDHCKCGSFVDDNGQHEGMTDKCAGVDQPLQATYDSDTPSIVDQGLVDFAKRVMEGKANFSEEYTVSKVSPRERKDIEQRIGRKFNADEHVIKASEIQHSLKYHGPNGLANQTMSNVEDFGLARYVISNYDEIYLIPEEKSSFTNSLGKSAEVIGYMKKIDGNKQIFVEAISDGKKGKLHIVSAYKNTKK